MYRKLIEKRITRKREQLTELTDSGVLTPDEKRKFVELKAVLTELENILDIAETMLGDGAIS